MNYKPYPLQFEPILKDKIWGGRKLKTILNKNITSDTTGESWELSAVNGDVSIVANGQYRGKTLVELLDDYAEEIVGSEVFKNFGNEFPLLFKFIDAQQDLSIQVHPGDELAQKRHNANGKTEMWYIMQADPGATLTIGFKAKSSQQEYLHHLQNNTLPGILSAFLPSEGDVFYLATGTVHAIGAGILLAEIQQTSDITYRIYDYDRVGPDGEKRELHIDQALDAINYEVVDTRRKYSKEVNISNSVVESNYFTTKFLPLDGEVNAAGKQQTFTVYMCVDGNFQLHYDEHQYNFSRGDTVLIPATMGNYSMSGKASLLEIYI
ncbi:MAG TPA: type I phosphomannose isomerase catalytic subunit [Flavobacterium sp.]|jgi:mannose-6-phosphate isomerase|nr:type I phosphomannose isomerase catalytic subunit [Flavobacterium sp.]